MKGPPLLLWRKCGEPRGLTLPLSPLDSLDGEREESSVGWWRRSLASLPNRLSKRELSVAAEDSRAPPDKKAGQPLLPRRADQIVTFVNFGLEV